jgi:hypothetical protein
LVLLPQGRALADLVQTVVRAVTGAAAATALLHGFEKIAPLQGICCIPCLDYKTVARGLRVRTLLLTWAAAAVLVVVRMFPMTMLTLAALPKLAMQELCTVRR